MPTALRPPKPRPRRRHAEEDLPEQSNQTADDVAVAVEPDAPFDPLQVENEGGMNFMDAITMITETEWEAYWLYLYRLDPQVRNAETDSKYIARYQCSMSEDEIQQQHGGGKYMFILKQNVTKEMKAAGVRPRERRFKFSIDGAPRLLRGQTLAGVSQDSAPNPSSSPGESEGAALVRSLPQLVKSISDNQASRDNNVGVNQVAEMIGQAAKGAINIVTETTRMQATSITGSAFGDKLLERFLESKEPQRSKVEDQLIQVALSRLTNPEQPAAGDGGISQLSAVKELLGVDNIFDLVKGGRGADDAWKGKLVEMGMSLVGNLPAILQMYFANQERQFQRALAARSHPTISGNPGAVAPPLPTIMGQPSQPPTARIDGQPAPPYIPPGVQQQPMDVTTLALDDIVNCFDAGLSGDAAASFLQRKYPQFVTMFLPLLQNDRQVIDQFCRNTPPLNEIAGEEGFSEFLTQFVQEMLNPSTEPVEAVESEPPPLVS